MSQPFEWPEMPPLDIKRVADAIQILWLDMTRKAEREAERDAEIANSIPGTQPSYGHGRRQYTIGSELGYKVIEILKSYDEGRTQHIKFLQGELMRLVSTQPMVWIGHNPPEEVKP